MSAAADTRTMGREHAQRLRAAEGLATPPTDPMVLRAIVDVLDHNDTADTSTNANNE